MTSRHRSDYPACLPTDVIDGKELRVTTHGRDIQEPDAFSPPLVSVITVVFNNARHIERAMESVFAQTYPNIEYIVIDGGSTDGTVDIIRQHASKLSYWHSKRDKGISDAFNMGVAASRGTYVGLVNSDDWMEPEQVASAAGELEWSGAPFVYGDLTMHRPGGELAYRVTADRNYGASIDHRMPLVNHPTCVVRRQVYETVGVFDQNWRIAMDYDWLLRTHLAGLEGVYVPDICGHMTLDGASDAIWWRGLKEVRQIAISHGTPSWRANVSFAWATSRSILRRVLQRIVPQGVMLRLRGALNPAVLRSSDQS